jgi:hypothetical protein
MSLREAMADVSTQNQAAEQRAAHTQRLEVALCRTADLGARLCLLDGLLEQRAAALVEPNLGKTGRGGCSRHMLRQAAVAHGQHMGLIVRCSKDRNEIACVDEVAQWHGEGAQMRRRRLARQRRRQRRLPQEENALVRHDGAAETRRDDQPRDRAQLSAALTCRAPPI